MISFKEFEDFIVGMTVCINVHQPIHIHVEQPYDIDMHKAPDETWKEEQPMAQLPAAFNPNAPGQIGITDYEAVDPGWYHAMIIESTMKPTKSGTGQFLELVWKIIGGPMNGRQIWQRLNLINPSTEAVEIAQKYLKSICDAVEVPGPITHSEVLHGRPCKIRVIKTEATPQYPEGNEIKGYQLADGSSIGKGGMAAVLQSASPAAMAAAAAAPMPAPGPVPAPPISETPPWMQPEQAVSVATPVQTAQQIPTAQPIQTAPVASHVTQPIAASAAIPETSVAAPAPSMPAPLPQTQPVTPQPTVNGEQSIPDDLKTPPWLREQ